MNDSRLFDPSDNSPFVPNDGPDPRCTDTPIEKVENWDRLRGTVKSPSGRYVPANSRNQYRET
jgi:hypothetical protein